MQLKLRKEKILYAIKKRIKLTRRLKPKLTKKDFASLLSNIIKLRKGDTIFLHSSLGQLRLNFDVEGAIDIILSILGQNGTVVVPTFPYKGSEQFLKHKEVFSVRETESGVGLLTEKLRKRKNARRSLHPIKSCAAIGKNAEYLLSYHYKSSLPYDHYSPFYRLIDLNAKIVGLGVSSWIFSFQHCVPDTFEPYPVKIHSDTLYQVKCLDVDTSEKIISTPYDLVDVIEQRNYSFIRQYYTKNEWHDFNYDRRNFYVVDSYRYYKKCVDLASKGITMYPRHLYEQAANRS
jgi:aminoglycoside 3-N-acetyltransferase